MKARKAIERVQSEEEALALGEELVNSPKEKANNLPILIAYIQQSEQCIKSEVSKLLTEYFMQRYQENEILVAGGERTAGLGQQDGNDGQQKNDMDVYRAWLTKMKDSFVDALVVMLSDKAAGALEQVSALACLMEFVRGERLGMFDHVLYLRILQVLLKEDGVESETLGAIIGKYCGYADAHYFTCKGIASMCTRYIGASTNDDENDVSADFLRNVYDALIHITDALDMFAQQEEDGSLPSWCGASEVGILVATNDGTTKRQRKRLRNQQNGSEQRETTVSGKWSSRKLRQKALSTAWIEFLKLEVPFDCYRSLLSRLHNTIIPALINPLLLSDFLTHVLDRGGLDGMLALNGIFILVTQYGLEYPKFYERLYGLLTPEVFLSKHRVRFFQLADIFLASPMVPAYTAAAFAKKFARLGIRGSSPAAIIAIAFIHNIIRRHPSCIQILHRPQPFAVTTAEEASKLKQKGEVWAGKDVYDEDEPNPAESRALESSLWEISVFRHHADPSVSQYSSVLNKDITNKLKSSEIDIAEVLASASYTSMFDREMKKKIKSVPTAIYSGTRTGAPTRVFSSGNVETLTLPGFIVPSST
ncbi:hypothetical protein M9434_007071 [Picochlorum sp. BPE23]|nr:hypothetical protein M9434_007071 [Picochlorum sp. BPE23]